MLPLSNSGCHSFSVQTQTPYQTAWLTHSHNQCCKQSRPYGAHFDVCRSLSMGIYTYRMEAYVGTGYAAPCILTHRTQCHSPLLFTLADQVPAALLSTQVTGTVPRSNGVMTGFRSQSNFESIHGRDSDNCLRRFLAKSLIWTQLECEVITVLNVATRPTEKSLCATLAQV
jgi:hypothetical protein